MSAPWSAPSKVGIRVTLVKCQLGPLITFIQVIIQDILMVTLVIQEANQEVWVPMIFEAVKDLLVVLVAIPEPQYRPKPTTVCQVGHVLGDLLWDLVECTRPLNSIWQEALMDRPVKYPQWVSHLTDPMDRNSVHQGAWALEDKGLHGPRCWNNNLENLHSIMALQAIQFQLSVEELLLFHQTQTAVPSVNSSSFLWKRVQCRLSVMPRHPLRGLRLPRS